MIYLDQDGVLADFVQGTVNKGIPNNHQWFEPRENWTAETLEGEKVKTRAMHSPGFWCDLPIMPGGRELWDFCHSHFGLGGVSVLTSKPQADSPSVVNEEKFWWLNANMGPIAYDRFHCCEPGTKQLYLQAGDILVDDDLRNAKGLVDGAYMIHHVAVYKREGSSIVMVSPPDLQSTITKIKELAHV